MGLVRIVGAVVSKTTRQNDWTPQPVAGSFVISSVSNVSKCLKRLNTNEKS